MTQLTLNAQIHNFQKEHMLPVSPKQGDTGIFTWNKDTPVHAEVLQVNKQNGYPLLEIQALIPISTETRRMTPEGWKTVTLWTLKPQTFSKVQVCYPEVEFAMIPRPLATPQAGDGFSQSLTDDWLPQTLNTQARLPHGLKTSNTNKFYSDSIYKFQLYLKRYEYEQEIAPDVKQKIPEVEITLPSPSTFYPSFQQCFDDFYHAKFAEPHRFKLDEEKWDVVEVRPIYKETWLESHQQALEPRNTYILGGTGQETTLPINLNEIQPNDVILRKGEWWKNERLQEVMSYIQQVGIRIEDA